MKLWLALNQYEIQFYFWQYQVSQFSLALNCVVRCLSAEPTVLSRLGPVLESAFAEQSDDPHLVSNVLHLIAVTANVWNAQGELQFPYVIVFTFFENRQ